MQILVAAFLFIATAICEIIGCYLPYLWLRQGRSAWLLLPAAIESDGFLLVALFAAHRCWQDLRRLWGCLHQCRHSLVMVDRRHYTHPVGRRWNNTQSVRHGGHHGCSPLMENEVYINSTTY